MVNNLMATKPEELRPRSQPGVSAHEGSKPFNPKPFNPKPFSPKP